MPFLNKNNNLETTHWVVSTGHNGARKSAPAGILFDYIDETNFSFYINTEPGVKFLVRLKKENFKLWNLLAQNERSCAVLNAGQKKYLFRLFNEFFIKNYKYGTYVEITSDKDKRRYSHILHSKYGDKFLTLLAKRYPNLHRQLADRNFEAALLKDTDQNLFFNLFNQFFRTGCADINILNPPPAMAKHIRQAKKKIYTASAPRPAPYGAEPRKSVGATIGRGQAPPLHASARPSEGEMLKDFLGFCLQAWKGDRYGLYIDPLAHLQIIIKDLKEKNENHLEADDIQYMSTALEQAGINDFAIAQDIGGIFILQDCKTGKYIAYGKESLRKQGCDPADTAIIQDKKSGKILFCGKRQLIGTGRILEKEFRRAVNGLAKPAENWDVILLGLLKQKKYIRVLTQANKMFKEKYGYGADIKLTGLKWLAYKPAETLFKWCGVKLTQNPETAAEKAAAAAKIWSGAIAGAVKGLIIDVPATIIHCAVNPLLVPLFFMNTATPEGFKRLKYEFFKTMHGNDSGEIAAYLSFNLFMAAGMVKHGGARAIGALKGAKNLALKFTKERTSVIIDGKEYVDTRVVDEVIKNLGGLRPSKFSVQRVKRAMKAGAAQSRSAGCPRNKKPAQGRIPPFGGKKKAVAVTPDGQRTVVNVPEQKSPPQTKTKKPLALASEGKPKDEYPRDPRLSEKFDKAANENSFIKMLNIADDARDGKFHAQAVDFYLRLALKAINKLDPDSVIPCRGDALLGRNLLHICTQEIYKILYDHFPKDTARREKFRKLKAKEDLWGVGKKFIEPPKNRFAEIEAYRHTVCSVSDLKLYAQKTIDVYYEIKEALENSQDPLETRWLNSELRELIPHYRSILRQARDLGFPPFCKDSVVSIFYFLLGAEKFETSLPHETIAEYFKHYYSGILKNEDMRALLNNIVSTLTKQDEPGERSAPREEKGAPAEVETRCGGNSMRADLEPFRHKRQLSKKQLAYYYEMCRAYYSIILDALLSNTDRPAHKKLEHELETVYFKDFFAKIAEAGYPETEGSHRPSKSLRYMAKETLNILLDYYFPPKRTSENLISENSSIAKAYNKLMNAVKEEYGEKYKEFKEYGEEKSDYSHIFLVHNLFKKFMTNPYQQGNVWKCLRDFIAELTKPEGGFGEPVKLPPPKPPQAPPPPKSPRAPGSPGEPPVSPGANLWDQIKDMLFPKSQTEIAVAGGGKIRISLPPEPPKKPTRMASEGKPKDGAGDYYEDPKLKRQFDAAQKINDFATMINAARKAFNNKHYFQAAQFHYITLCDVLESLPPSAKILLHQGETIARWLLSDTIDSLMIICKKLPHDADVAHYLKEMVRARETWDTFETPSSQKPIVENPAPMPGENLWKQIENLRQAKSPRAEEAIGSSLKGKLYENPMRTDLEPYKRKKQFTEDDLLEYYKECRGHYEIIKDAVTSEKISRFLGIERAEHPPEIMEYYKDFLIKAGKLNYSYKLRFAAQETFKLLLEYYIPGEKIPARTLENRFVVTAYENLAEVILKEYNRYWYSSTRSRSPLFDPILAGDFFNPARRENDNVGKYLPAAFHALFNAHMRNSVNHALVEKLMKNLVDALTKPEGGFGEPVKLPPPKPPQAPRTPGSPGAPGTLDDSFWNKLRGSHKEFFPKKSEGEK